MIAKLESICTAASPVPHNSDPPIACILDRPLWHPLIQIYKILNCMMIGRKNPRLEGLLWKPSQGPLPCSHLPHPEPTSQLSVAIMPCTTFDPSEDSTGIASLVRSHSMSIHQMPTARITPC